MLKRFDKKRVLNSTDLEPEKILVFKQKLHNKKCDVCRNIRGTRHIDIYTLGSEGINICQECENKITEFVRNLSREGLLKYKNDYIKAKRRVTK